MKKLITLFVASALIVLGGFTIPPMFAGASKIDKVTICHATGSESNPFNTIHTSPNAINGHFENNGTTKSGHEDDLLFEGEVTCPTGGGGGGGGGGSTPSCTDGIQNQNETGIDTGGVCGGGGGGGGCTLPTAITGFDVQSAVPNDGQNELVWTATSTTATSINIQWGLEDGVWTNSSTSTNDGFEAITGLPNGIPHWFQLQPVNACGVGNWGVSIDPLP